MDTPWIRKQGYSMDTPHGYSLDTPHGYSLNFLKQKQITNFYKSKSYRINLLTQF